MMLNAFLDFDLVFAPAAMTAKIADRGDRFSRSGMGGLVNNAKEIYATVGDNSDFSNVIGIFTDSIG